MTGLHKFSLKSFCCTFVTIAFCIVITLHGEARDMPGHQIYTTLTADTIPRVKRLGGVLPLRMDTVPVRRNTGPVTNDTTRNPQDSTRLTDTLAPVQRVDTFSLKMSKDTLDAPVNYEAEDSAILLVKEKRFLLYGKTKTTYKDIVLTAPRVVMNQETNILTAYNSVDSIRNGITRARFQQGQEGFESDTIEFNFKTQRGLTKNTFTRQQEMFVNAEVIKKINSNTTFARRVTMTTCDYDVPHFGFVSNKGKFINDKIAVTGPVHPEFEGVPIPIYLPFGIFPLQKGRHSGLLPPQFAVNEQFGIGLEGLGYYHVLNDYVDVTFRSNIYSYGGWSATLTPSYRKRYRYNGTLNFSLNRTKYNFKGDPDYQLLKTYALSWSHNVDSRAKPGTTFGANVNIQSSRHNQTIPNNPYRNFENMLTSSINYTKQWRDKPYNLSLSANHNQNNNNHLINLILPDAGFTVATLYPFQRKEITGTPKWYEKFGIGYNATARNMLSFYDTAKKSFNQILDTMQWGAQHRFPINMALPPLGKVMISPSISYEQTWLTHRVGRAWNNTLKKVDTVFDRKGLFIDNRIGFGLSANTALYGKFQFRGGKLKAIRHVIRPNIGFNYTPNISKQYYDVIQVNSSGYRQAVSQFQGNNMFSGYGYGKFGGLTFGVDQNLEMKWRGKKDTVEKKIRLIDGFSINSAYNFLQDSLKLTPIGMSLRSTLFEKINISASATLDPYERGPSGQQINRYVWQGDRFRPGRITGANISMSTMFQSKPRNPSQGPNPLAANNANGLGNDPALLSDQQRLQEYMHRNPADFVDFNIPWSINISMGITFNRIPKPDFSGYTTDVSSSVNFSNSFSLTPQWNFTTNGFLDLKTKKLGMFSMSISRDLHCWQMSINVTPVGPFRFFNVTISPKSSILQNLKVNRTRYFSSY